MTILKRIRLTETYIENVLDCINSGVFSRYSVYVAALYIWIRCLTYCFAFIKEKEALKATVFVLHQKFLGFLIVSSDQVEPKWHHININPVAVEKQLCIRKQTLVQAKNSG